MKEMIKKKKRTLNDLFVLQRCTDKEIEHLEHAKTEIELDNIAHTLIMKYME